MEAFCRVLGDFSDFAAAQQICRLGRMEDKGEKSGVPTEVDSGLGARGCAMTHVALWPLATRPNFPQSWKFTAIPGFSAESGIQGAREAANRDGLTGWVAERAIDGPWLGRRWSFAARSSRSNEWRN
jgi:hypothetical protein